jgi:FkbM family methyltransferase
MSTKYESMTISAHSVASAEDKGSDRKILDKLEIFIDPFPLGVVDNFLPQDVFQRARAFWLKSDNLSNVEWDGTTDTIGTGKAEYKSYGGGRDVATQSKIHDLLKGSPDWLKIFEVFECQALADEIYQAMKNRNLKCRPFQIRTPNYKQGILDALFRRRVYVNYKLSSYPVGSGISLHRDLADKDVAFLYYFGFTDGKERDIGGTQFYRRTKNTHLSNLEVDHFVSNIDDFALIRDIEPKSNRLAFFVRSDKSWHGVNAFYCPSLEEVTRINLQINYMKCKPTNSLAACQRLARAMYSVSEFATHYIVSLKNACAEGLAFQTSDSPATGKISWRNRILKCILPSSTYNVMLQLYLYVRGPNLLIDKRRRLIRRTVLKYSMRARGGLAHAANYAIDLNRMNGVSAALCFGIYNDLRFEQLMAKKFNLRTIAADPTPIAIKTVQNTELHPNLVFSPSALSVTTGVRKFFFDSDEKSYENFEGSLQNICNSSKFIEVHCENLASFKERLGIRQHEKYILKMDIEGGAIEILEDLLSKGATREDLPAQIMVELELPRRAYDSVNYRISGLLASLRKHYDVFYIPRMKRYANYDFLFVLR